jgi:hypothetical protein
MSGAFKKWGQEPLFTSRALVDLFEKYGGVDWAHEAGFFSEDPAIKASRDTLLQGIPPELLPARLRSSRFK